MFCSQCGNLIPSDSKFCMSCGSSVEHSSAAVGGFLIQGLIKRLRAEIAAWCVVIFVQIVLAVVFLALFEFTVLGIICVAVAVLNIAAVHNCYVFLQQIKIKPVGIVARYEGMSELWLLFAVNVTVGIGIGFFAWVCSTITRSFVLENKQGFIDLEK